MFGNKGSYTEFKNSFSAGNEKTVEQVRDVLKGHGFLLKQLRAHQHEIGIEPLLLQYEQLGTELPSEALLKSTYQKLARTFHPDRNAGPEATELMKQLNTARDALTNPEQRLAYEQALLRAPEKIREWLTKIHEGKFDESMKKAFRAAQKRIENSVKAPTEGFSKWLNDMSPTNRGALIFGGIIATAAGVYVLAKSFDKKPHATNESKNWQRAVEKTDADQHTQRVM